MEDSREKTEYVCGCIFLALFLLSLLVICARFITGPKRDIFELENRLPNPLAKLTPETIMSGAFQDKLEPALADQYLFSETIHMKSSAIDRAIFNQLSWISIKPGTKYRLVGNDVYVFSNGDHLLSKKNNISKEYFLYDDSSEAEGYRKTVKASADFYNNLPIKNKYLYFITNDTCIDFDTNIEPLSDQLASQYTTFKWSRLNIPDYETYEKYYRKNDHHWNHIGSYEGYKDIVKLIFDGKEEAIEPVEEVDFDFAFWGSRSINGNFYDFPETFTAYRFNLDDHEVYTNGKAGYGSQDEFFNNKKLQKSTTTITYGAFYGGDESFIEYNFHQPQKQNLIIIGYSDTNAINALIASHFNKTYILDPRFSKLSIFETLVNSGEIDNLLLLPNTSGLLKGLILSETPGGY